MFENLKVFRMARALAEHAGARQALAARNMANADTPGYAPADLVPFGDLVGSDGTHLVQKSTRPRHITLGATETLGNGSSIPIVTKGEAGSADPNGNSVSLELEMLRAIEIKRQHDRAVTVYKSALGILRTSIGRR